MAKIEQSRINRVNKQRKRKWVYRSIILFCIGLFGIGGYIGWHIWSSLSGSQDSLGTSKLRKDEVEIKKEPFAVLLIGADQTSSKEYWRPDTLMVAAINPKTNSVKLVSIPRDTYVEIANTNEKKDKINHSAAHGKTIGMDPMQNTRETVEQFLNIPIDHYAKVNFQGFIDIVDTLGGVDVEVPFYFSTQSHTGKPLRFYEGPMHLNGEQALAYVRMRKKYPKHIKGDIARNEKQREVMSQLIDKMVSVSGLAKFGEVSEAVGNNFKYSFNLTDIPSLSATYKQIPKENIESIQLETISEQRGSNQTWYEICSKEERIRVSKILQQQLEYIPEKEMTESDAYPSIKKNTIGDGN